MSLAVRDFLTIFFAASVLTLPAWGSEAPAGEKEAPKQVKSREESYMVVQARVAALEAKIRSAEAEVQKLILEKQQAKDPVKVNEILDRMMVVHNEMKQNNKEYDQQRTLLKYRYPEKGSTSGREYERIDLKTLGEMETEMSLGGSVKRTLNKVRVQYGKVETSKGQKPSHQPESQVETPKAHQSLIDPVILKK